MDKGLSVRVFLAALLAIGMFLPAADQTPLPERYKKWLEEDVVYLTTPMEKQVFLQLESDRERDLFVNAFWKQRDPITLTDHNEFKDEHYRRIEYANKQFGRLSSLPGWKTDRGRIYISIGPPLTINRYEGFSSIYPVEVWNYQGMAEYGLPDMFRIVFYRKFGSGDYVLYSPSMDGPRSLIGSSLSISVDAETAAYNEIYGNDPILAECSLSLIPGEIAIRGTPSLESESLLLALKSAPHKRVRDEYAKKLLLYDTQIDVEYTANYVGNNSQVKIVRDDSGLFFINYLIEFDKFSMEEHEGVNKTQLLVNGSVTDAQKRVIFQFDRPVPVKLDREQIETVRQQRFCLQDLFPLAPGDYWLKILVKNEASKEFTSIETPIHVPDGKDLQISPLILAYKKEQDSSGKMKAFKTEGLQLFSSPRNDFSNADTLILFLQLTGDRPPAMTGGSLRITVFRGDEEFRKVDIAIKPEGDAVNGWEEFPLAGFPADYYRMRVALVTAEG
ncbi:MAG: GWxTD domain-containing protein, partial [Deltaproteobacteria bacterium]